MKIGDKIQRQRKELSMSQETLAEKLDVSRQAVSKWELGESIPDTANVVLLSKIFGVTTDYLLIDECAGFDGSSAKVIEESTAELNPVNPRSTARASLFAVTAIIFGISGLLLILILSSVLEADKRVIDGFGPPVEVRIDPDTGEWTEIIHSEFSEIPRYTTIKIRGDLHAFLTTFHLEWLMSLCVILTVGGIIALSVIRKHDKSKQIARE